MSDKPWHQLSGENAMQVLQTNAETGLSSAEARRRRERFGPNVLEEKKTIPPLAIFLSQFKDFMVLVLLAATLISVFLGEYLDAVTIIAIIVINGILGFVQEFRAERSLQALKRLAAPTARTLRDGVVTEIPAEDLVPGDIVMLESGDRIPADVRFLEVNGLYMEESALTGESVPVGKHEQPIGEVSLPVGDRKNMGFKGTIVVRGSARALVVQTGMQTEMGKIANLIQHAEKIGTPLQHRLAHLGKILILLALMLTVAVVLAGIMHGQPFYTMLLAGVSLAVAAIPEGLPAMVTIALALGVQRMIRRKAIVRKLPSVETLGCATVICSDKTGTLTQNKMTVTRIWYDGAARDVSGEGYEPHGKILFEGKEVDIRGDQTLRRLLQISVLCNNAFLRKEDGTVSLSRPERAKRRGIREKANWTIQGDPTEGALIVLGAKAGVTSAGLKAMYERVREFPFDPERKRMSVIVRHQGGRLVYCKGAADLLLERCKYVLWKGKIVPVSDFLRRQVLSANEEMARSALRVLGMAYRELREDEVCDHEEQAENGLIFVGLAGMIDPPRAEAKEAIWRCREAGIKTVMITGDHQTTAEAIARSLRMIPAHGRVVNGAELSAMSDDVLEEQIENFYVYARVSPEHKLRIVKALQKKGHVVAMTGDGVNDAPAIKAADIGIAMGIAGTDVAKEASDLVLSDDNFATIVAAIEEGRSIYENIRKFIRYLLASNVGEILVMLVAMLAGMPLPLIAIQILWINLVTDGLPAMALGVDQAEDDLMKQKPRKARENIFARRLGWKIISRGLLIGFCTLAAFWLTLRGYAGDETHLARAQTVAFATLVFAQLVHVFDCRSSRSIFHRSLLQNRLLVLAVISSIALMLGVLYIDPVQEVFHTVDLGLREWALIIVFALIPSVLTGIGSVHGGRSAKKRLARRTGRFA